MEDKNQMVKTGVSDLATETQEKTYYKVYSITQLESLIQEIKDNSHSEKNKKNGCATIVLEFEESDTHKGQLHEIGTNKLMKDLEAN